MKELGKGIATVGVWAAVVGIVYYNNGTYHPVGWATLATLLIWTN